MNTLEVLTKCYTEPHRRFHTLEHIAFMFRKANEHSITLNRAQSIAIWFHDSIYVPGAQDNEEKSARLAHDHLNHLQDLDFLRIISMIRDTKHHQPRNMESAIVSDLDMLILAESKVSYRRYAKQVRHEFKTISDDEYRHGRLQFLIELQATAIFHSHTFSKYRMKAIENIDMEIKTLKRST